MPVPSEELAQSHPPSYVRLRYSPPQYLISSSGLSRDEFIAQYEAFVHSLEHVTIAPELVFERLVGNLNDVSNGVLAQEQTNQAALHAVQEAWTRERTALLAAHASAQQAWAQEKAKLESDLAAAKTAIREHEKFSRLSRAPVPSTVTPVPANSDQTYLKFWFGSSPTFNRQATSAHMTATTAPVSYGLCSSCPGTDHILSSPNHGTYDTRLDAILAPSVTLPATITHIVCFKDAFATPPSRVMVWLTGLSANTGDALSVQATANNITETEFALQVSSGAGSRLLSVGVAWAVWPEKSACGGEVTAKVCSVSTKSPGTVRLPDLASSGVLAGVTSPVFVALSAVDLVLGGNMWVDVEMTPQTLYGGSKWKWEMKAGPVAARVYSVMIACASLG